MVICGVDPGLSGAICFYATESNGPYLVNDMPTLELKRGGKLKREIDARVLVRQLAAVRPGHAFVELVGAMPGQGVSSVFAFGKGYGIVLGIIAALGIPMTQVAPVTWKKAMRVPAAKDGARARASDLMPASAHFWPLKKHDGRAEAALIALWGAQALNMIARGAA